MAICLNMLLSSIEMTFMNGNLSSFHPWPDLLLLIVHNSALNLHPSLCLLQK